MARALKIPHTELSTKKCTFPGCNKFIKQRLVDSSSRFTECYEHHCVREGKRGHTINTQPRKVRVVADLPVKNFNKDEVM